METISKERYFRLLSKSAREKNIPFSGHFELTPLCNLDCRMCYVHLQDPAVKERMLSGREWISIMKQAIQRGMMCAVLTGGEALTHPDFWTIYDFLQSEGLYVRLKTNGILLTGETIERFAKHPPTNIDISLYGCDRESYLAVTGHDVFDTVIENIRAAKDAELSVHLMVVPSRPMMPYLDGILALAKSLDVPVLVNELLIAPREDTGREKENFDLSRDEYLGIARKRRELFPDEFRKNEDEEPEEITQPHAAVPEKGLRCGGGRSVFAVHWDGMLVPCLNFSAEMIGEDVRKTGFDAAWQSVNRGVREFPVPAD